MKIIAIEGICSAGKSTLINKLMKSINIFVSDDYFDLCKGNYPFSDDNIDIINERKEQMHFFSHLDSSRLKDLDTKKTAVVLDRSIFSILAYSYSKGKLFDIDLLSPSLEIIASYNIILPDIIIYLNVDYEKAKIRNHLRGFTGILAEEEFNHYFVEFFVNVYPTLASQINPLPLIYFFPDNELSFECIKSLICDNGD